MEIIDCGPQGLLVVWGGGREGRMNERAQGILKSVKLFCMIMVGTCHYKFVKKHRW